jgi:NAD(P)H-nitrite reductase large subunit
MRRYPSWSLLREDGTHELAISGDVILWHSGSTASCASSTIREAGILTIVSAYQCAICGERFADSAGHEMVEAVECNGSSFAAHYPCVMETDYELA